MEKPNRRSQKDWNLLSEVWKPAKSAFPAVKVGPLRLSGLCELIPPFLSDPIEGWTVNWSVASSALPGLCAEPLVSDKGVWSQAGLTLLPALSPLSSKQVTSLFLTPATEHCNYFCSPSRCSPIRWDFGGSVLEFPVQAAVCVPARVTVQWKHRALCSRVKPPVLRLLGCLPRGKWFN